MHSYVHTSGLKEWHRGQVHEDIGFYMKKPKNDPLWSVAVIITDAANKRIFGSFLGVQARNRFLALKATAAQLPDNPKLLDQGGQLLPYEVVCLEQCCECCISLRLMEYAEVFDSTARKPAG